MSHRTPPAPLRRNLLAVALAAAFSAPAAVPSLTALACLMAAGQVFATQTTAPTLSAPIVNASSGIATLTLQSSASGTGYFTLLPGTNATCGTGTQTKAGQDSNGGAAYRIGSLPLVAATPANYTVRNLAASTAYTACFSADDGTTLQGTDATANLTTTAMASPSNPSWSEVGSAGFSADSAPYTSLSFAPDGTPYVAYRDHGNSDKATVMKLSAGSWSVVGSAGFSAGAVNATSLSFAPDGTPYVTYTDDGNTYKATVMKFDGSSWSVVGSADFSAGAAFTPSLSFAPDGTPYVAYQDGGNGNLATVMKFNGSQWSLVGTAGFSTGNVGDIISLSFAPDGTPYVAYPDASNSYKATVMKFSANSWSTVGSAMGAASDISLAFAPNGTPYVAYKNVDNNDKATVMKYSAGSWSLVGNADFSADYAEYTSLAFAPDGTPYVAYSDGNTDAKATVIKLAAGISAPAAPTIGTATAGNGSVSIAFTPPENNGGANIDEYTVSCNPANSFGEVEFAFNQTGTASPITVSGLTNGVEYRCLVKAKNSAGYGDYSSFSANFTPAAPPSSGGNDNYTPPPSNTLPTGGGTATLTGGQSVEISDNGKDGTAINLPPPSTGTTGVNPGGNSVNVTLPGTGKIGVSSDSSGTQLGVSHVTLPGATTSVSTVMVDQGSATFTATKEGQPLASLKNGIFVVSGATNSKVTVDATDADTKIGVTSSDTIVVPTGSTHVAGTRVDLPPPTASGGAAGTVSVKIGEQSLTIQASQADTKMTFKVVDIGGVQTPVLAVTGSAQVSGSGDNQPIVSVAGNVIRTGKRGGSGSQVCNTVIQASSDTSSDAVHVVTCYVVLDAGSFSALNRGKNSFAAIKDGIVWAGETAEFDKSGKVTSAYLGSRSGNSDAVGDDMAPGGAKFAAGGYNVNAFIPRLNGTPLRLNGAKLDERLFGVVNQALGVSVQPVLPVQSDQGVLNFTFAGNLNGQGVQNPQVAYTINSDTASVLPSRRIRVDTSRADGLTHLCHPKTGYLPLFHIKYNISY